ncbi:DUF4153 domain-containing protein, partial (plasmid) [Chromobacterium amazonense]|uniref:DUF4153 domain-containing protein n=1 Tax=Chromobacterium amazonense TaxID=1382803 RepID=UPI00237DE4B5
QALAAYALALRVGQYGWSPDRVFAASLVILGACYAAGYGWAAIRRRAGFAGVASANIYAAWLSLALLAAVLTPLADPARISVGSQLARLQAGRVAAERFDFDFLRDRGLRYGHAALLRMEGERRWRASYPAYFDTAWKLGLQLMFSGLFVGVFWLILNLGAELFALVGMDGLRRLIGEAEFAIPASTLALSAGLHLSDARPGIIQGLRSLLLTLLSWLLPLLVLLIAAFLALLPFTGLDSLWKTGHASALLLGASGLLIFLLNAAYQDGREQPGRVIRLSLRAACLLLAPLQALAAYALALRVGQYGWSPDRVFAAWRPSASISIFCATAGCAMAMPRCCG